VLYILTDNFFRIFAVKNKKMDSIKDYYNSNYFEYQTFDGIDFIGYALHFKFKDYIQHDNVVLDFGCGGGYLFKFLKCKKKAGIEINPIAAVAAKNNGVEIFQSVDDVPEEYADVVISNHALEHTENPMKELQGLHNILRTGGKAIIIVPCESIRWKYRKNDLDRHLFTWSPMCIGNLMKAAGFNVLESRPYYGRWFRPFRSTIIKLAGWKFYQFLCKIYGHFGPISEVRVVAEKIKKG